MKENTEGKQLLLWVLLVAIFLLALLSFMQRGTEYIGKSYLDQEDFQAEVDVFIRNLSASVLNPLDIEKEKAKIVVTDEEIEDHRNRYGTLSEQIGNIEEQYKDRIADAKAAASEKLTNALIEERDSKIEDIRKNFEEDAHVEKKLRAEKERQLVNDWENTKREQNRRIDLRMAYKLKDVKTGEIFESGNTNPPFVYEKQFFEEAGYLVADQDDLSGYHYYSSYGDTYTDAVSEYATTGSTNEIRKFEGVVTLPKSALTEGSLKQQIKRFDQVKYTLYFLWLIGILSGVALFTIFRFKKEWVLTSRYVGFYETLKMDLKIGLLFFTGFVVYVLLDMIPNRISYYYFHMDLGNWITIGFQIAILLIFLWATVFQLVLIVDRLKQEGALEKEFKRSYCAKFLIALQDMFLNRTIGKQMLLLLTGFFLAGIGFVGVLFQPVLLVVYLPLVLFVAFPILYIFIRRAAYFNKIIVATEAMADGRLQQGIEVRGKSPLAKHAMNLNNLREGVRISLTEQAKSERLKTELITNVSHDLRTPLTSIITYTDLLKNPDLQSEERAKYVDILDKKSQRLKTLIEDLFEVSKMASGNLELHKQRVDLTQLLQQALAEHAEEIAESGLDFRTALPSTELIAHVDGQKWWRVLDNLIVNAIKYTLPGTRVYIHLKKVDGYAEFIVKNITKYEIGENVDELYERFKRADTSRHTDGSGLGLAIAQSIVDLHGGSMKIEVDGDLFKVTVGVPIL